MKINFVLAILLCASVTISTACSESSTDQDPLTQTTPSDDDDDDKNDTVDDGKDDIKDNDKDDSKDDDKDDPVVTPPDDDKVINNPDKARGTNRSIDVVPTGYQLVEELSDEFNGTTLDLDKWDNRSGRGGWKGRGARFMAENANVKDGALQLKPSVIGTDAQLKELYQLAEQTFVKDKSKWYGDDLDPNTWDPMTYGTSWAAGWGTMDNVKYQRMMELGLETLGAASVVSKKYGKQGIYEARIKASKIPMSSAFWLQGQSTEFDITESCGGRSVVENNYLNTFPHKIQTSLWVNARNWNGINFQNKGGVEHKSTLVNFDIWSEYFILSMKWEETRLIVSVNDKPVYVITLTDRATTKNDDGTTPIGTPIPLEIFAEPQQVLFDTEMLWGPDHGWPTKSDLTGRADGLDVYYVDWVRVWEPIDNAWSDELYNK